MLDMVATLYGSIGVNMNQTLPEEYVSVLQAECIDDNTLLHVKNSHDGTSLNTSKGSYQSGKTNAAKLIKLQAALSTKLYLIVW